MTDEESRQVTRQLNLLFEGVPNPDTGRPYLNAEVARATGVAASTISQIRSGAKPNPTASTLEALAKHFGVTPNYFFDLGDERAAAARELLASAEENHVRTLAFRTNGLSTDSLRMIKSVIEQARKLEGLDNGDDKENS